MSDCEICGESVEPGDMVIQVYNIVDMGDQKAYQELPGHEGGPHVHLSCVLE